MQLVANHPNFTKNNLWLSNLYTVILNITPPMPTYSLVLIYYISNFGKSTQGWVSVAWDVSINFSAPVR